jgi:GTP-binding protein
LLDFKYNRKYIAEDGQPGGNSLKDGRNGNDIIIKVPVGTIIKDEETGKVLCDLNENGKQFVAAKGGKGGKGNSNFATPTNQTPRYAEKGKPGDEKNIILELKLIADVGLVGFPNAGKSTLISTVSAARPKIADYPFTTLEPNLGIVRYKEYDSFTIADIPGIIEGAHEGKGLGLKFLRHIERTKILLIMVEAISDDYQRDFDILLKELKNYSKTLATKKKIFGISKADLLTPDRIEKVKSLTLNNHKEKIIVFSAVSGYGMDELLDTLWTELKD